MAKLLQGGFSSPPINLLPCATFRGTDNVNIRHIDNLTDMSTTTFYSSGYGSKAMAVQIRAVYCNLHNVNLTIGNDGVRVTSEVYPTNKNSSPAIWIIFSYNVPNNKVMTIGYRSRNRRNVRVINPNIANNHNVLYRSFSPSLMYNRNTSEPMLHEQILMATSQTSASGMVCQASPICSYGQTVNVDFTLYDFFIFEGHMLILRLILLLMTKQSPCSCFQTCQIFLAK